MQLVEVWATRLPCVFAGGAGRSTGSARIMSDQTADSGGAWASGSITSRYAEDVEMSKRVHLSPTRGKISYACAPLRDQQVRILGSSADPPRSNVRLPSKGGLAAVEGISPARLNRHRNHHSEVDCVPYAATTNGLTLAHVGSSNPTSV